jgi:hypothetical protein
MKKGRIPARPFVPNARQSAPHWLPGYSLNATPDLRPNSRSSSMGSLRLSRLANSTSKSPLHRLGRKPRKRRSELNTLTLLALGNEGSGGRGVLLGMGENRGSHVSHESPSVPWRAAPQKANQQSRSSLCLVTFERGGHRRDRREIVTVI